MGPVACDVSESSLVLDKPQLEQVSLGFQSQDVKTKELDTKRDSEISKKGDSKLSDVSKSSVPLVIASPELPKESTSKNLKDEFQLNSQSFETDRQHPVPIAKLYQDTEGQQIQPFRQRSTELDQPSLEASFNTVSDLSKIGTQKIADLRHTPFVGEGSADIPGQSNHKNLQNSVGLGKESLGDIGSSILQSASSQLWSNGKFVFPKDSSAKSAYLPSTAIQGNRTESSGTSFSAANISGDLAVKPFHFKDSCGTSTSVNYTGTPVQGGGQRTSTGQGNIGSLPSLRSSQMAIQENFASGKSPIRKQPSKEDYRTPPPGVWNSEPSFSKQFGNVMYMAYTIQFSQIFNELTLMFSQYIFYVDCQHWNLEGSIY